MVCGFMTAGAMHSTHGAPPPPEYFPSGQSSHAITAVSARNRPASHETQNLSPTMARSCATTVWPAGQCTHASKPGEGCTLPVGHSKHAEVLLGRA
jgi:hypothetical protein